MIYVLFHTLLWRVVLSVQLFNGIILMKKGRFTIPTDESFVEGTKIIAKKWGADAVRDCDGTRLPENAK